MLRVGKLLLLRWFVFISGLFIMSFGVALSVKANLGISPISCFPYVLSLRFPMTIGQLTVIFNALIILLQIGLLRKKYRPFQLIQLPVVFLFGFFIDFTMSLISDLTVEAYLIRLAICVLSCLVIGTGVFIEVKAKVTYLPGEGLALAIVELFKVEFGKTKIGVDCSMVSLGVISSFILLGTLQGVREGTVIAAVLIGWVARTLGKRLRVFNGISI